MQERSSQSEYHKRHYAKHREAVKQKAKEYQAKNRQKLREYKANLACSRCGFDHPAALQFHHREPSEKAFNLASAVSDGKSWETILAEIAKCDVLCANCHAIEHYVPMT